ncbi:MAG: LysM peptidoglycan-binding domain-containing protein [Deltaproteobacteria bacterium]|nr:LysM peptidoglycan-binding domain-containing protein [Deltaproteobacteria bacterium]
MPVEYLVKDGDTLSEISRRFNVSTGSIQRLNNLSGDRIYPGQKLRLRPYTTPDGRTCIVRKGDTLSDIAREYGLGVQDIKELNELRRDTIYPGMKLIIAEAPEEEEPVQFEYVVKEGDNLFSISRRFDVGLDLLRQLNGIKGKNIYPGQKLQLRPSSLDEAVYVVRQGDTLTGIAQKYNIKISTLRRLNGIKGNKILVGEKLRIKASQTGIHLVERGDALWEIALAYGMTVDEIKELNGLATDQIYPGQELKLSPEKSKTYDQYKVKPGDYLNDIARLHQMDLSELMKINNLNKSLIHPGDILKVNPILRDEGEWLKISEISWDNLVNPQTSIKGISAGNGPYYHTKPKASSQTHKKYFEGPTLPPLTTYRRASELMSALDNEIIRLGRLSKDLEGWHFVLDPGHGGQDPGAIAKTSDGGGNVVYVVEDEYVYDVALRVYVLLRLHSAQVTLTILSPNHLIRGSSPPSLTFVNEKNEVYNSYDHNSSNKWKDWPNGGRNGNLYTRVEIAKKAYKDVPKKRTIFLSFHADIDPNMPEAPLVLYYRSRKSGWVDSPSKDFAKSLLPALGAGAYSRGQNLGVLRNNPASVKVLIELRNLAYTDHAWALRFEELRHRDAEKVVRGIMEYVKSKS